MNSITRIVRNTIDQPSLCVLMYHGIHEGPSSAAHFNPIYSVSRADFERQLDAVRDSGLRTTSLTDTAGRPGSVLITFDDGDESNLTVAVPLLRDRGMVAEFFISTRFIGTPGMLSAAQVRELADAGMGIGSHGHTHRYLSELSPSELRDELVRSKDTLESLSGGTVLGLALPGGRGGRRELVAARAAGYRHVFDSVPRTNRGRRPDRYLNRFAVRRQCSPARFAELLTGAGHARQVELARYAALSVPRRLLGDDGYRALRARALSGASR